MTLCCSCCNCSDAGTAVQSHPQTLVCWAIAYVENRLSPQRQHAQAALLSDPCFCLLARRRRSLRVRAQVQANGSYRQSMCNLNKREFLPLCAAGPLTGVLLIVVANTSLLDSRGSNRCLINRVQGPQPWQQLCDAYAAHTQLHACG